MGKNFALGELTFYWGEIDILKRKKICISEIVKFTNLNKETKEGAGGLSFVFYQINFSC